jgi:aspartyl-tRNA(Asn)/glutamyl-tRNA(Gln) amidotransferase subunit A
MKHSDPARVSPPTDAHPAGIEARAASSAVDESEGLTWLPAWRLRELIVAGEVSSVEVVRHFLDRIDRFEPSLNAFRLLDAAGALEQAARADDAVRAGVALGPLHGVPIAVKELFFVEGFPVPGTYASYLADRDAEVPLATRDDIEVERLRAAGAVIVGVTVAALGATPGMTDSSQLPHNPWVLSHTAGASSAGNGAAVAAGLVPLALGDDGGGSIRVPSAFNGLVGVTPTRGRVPHIDYRSPAPRPVVGVGPMTRSVRDAAVTLQLLAGPDGRDVVCLQDDPADYLATLDSGVRGTRFLWTDDFGFASMPASVASPQTLALVREAADQLERQGAVVTQTPVTWEAPLLSWLAVAQLENGPLPPDWAEYALSDQEVVDAFDARARNWRRFRDVFDQHDFVLSPTVAYPAPELDAWVELCQEEGGHPKHLLVLESVAALTMMCNVLGLPALSVPAGFVDGLPVGLQVIGRPGSEGDLLRVAQAFLAGRSDSRNVTSVAGTAEGGKSGERALEDSRAIR